MSEIKNLMQGLCEEIDRVKEIVQVYESTLNGHFAAFFMKQDVEAAENARNIGYTIQMMALYEKLKGYDY